MIYVSAAFIRSYLAPKGKVPRDKVDRDLKPSQSNLEASFEVREELSLMAAPKVELMQSWTPATSALHLVVSQGRLEVRALRVPRLRLLDRRMLELHMQRTRVLGLVVLVTIAL